jgi:hypothetical protein
MAPVEDLNLNPLQGSFSASVSELMDDLKKKHLLGPGSRLPLLNSLWEAILPRVFEAFEAFEATSPVFIAKSLTNTLYHLCLSPSSDPEGWLKQMKQGLVFFQNSYEMLDFAFVTAWMAGLPHLRAQSLEKLDSLGDSLLAVLFEDTLSANELRLGLKSSAFWHPQYEKKEIIATAESACIDLSLVHRIGSFRGWGGPFILPPTLYTHNGHCFVQSHSDSWILSADAFGWCLNRIPNLPVACEPALAIDNNQFNWQELSFKLTKKVPIPLSGVSLSTFYALAFPASFEIWILSKTV